MKKTLLQKILIVMLSSIPAAMAVNMNASAEETVLIAENPDLPESVEEAFVSEELNLPENEDETAIPEETEIPANKDETVIPEETELPENEDETVTPEETELPGNEDETVIPEETELPGSEDETVIPEETEIPGNEDETAIPEETEIPVNEDETVIPEETILPGSEDETALLEEENLPGSGDEAANPEEAVPSVSASEAEMVNGKALLSVGGFAAKEKHGEKESVFDRIHYIRLADIYAASDSILIESNGRFGLIDASHPSSDPDPNISRHTADVDDVITYLQVAGVMHLDFVLGTHSHSDHIGGMKFLASALNKAGNYWIDSSTVYYYKNHQYNEQEEGEWGWQNTRMFRQAVEAMAARGAIMVETSTHSAEALRKANAVFVKGGDGPVSDSIKFSLGDFVLSLFNLYHNSSENENLNSIVTAVTKDDRTTLLMGDLEMEGGYERKIANTVASKYKNADVIKAGHHGYEECTGSDMLRTLQPSYIVTTSNRTQSFYDDEPPYNYYLSYHGITAYRAAESVRALVEELTGDGIRFYTYDSRGNLTKKPTEWKARMTSGWKKWNRDDGTYDYIFVREDGSVATGWNWLTRNGNTNWYLFGKDGLSLKGFQKDGQSTYYLNSKGEMQTGWLYSGGKWYYLKDNGAMLTGWKWDKGKWYYMNSKGVMQTGWVNTGGKWYYLNSSGAMLTGWQYLGGKWYYLSSSGAMLTGWQYLGGKWYYLSSSGAMLTGWQHLGGKWYYLSGSGAMLTGWQYLGGKWYYLSSSGAMLTGWQWLGGKWYYLSGSGAMLTGWQKIDGVWYYFYSSGALK